MPEGPAGVRREGRASNPAAGPEREGRRFFAVSLRMLDDRALRPKGGDETADLHAIVCAPFRPASMILTSHREPSAWQGSLADLLPGPALVDRFGNSANGLENEGASG